MNWQSLDLALVAIAWVISAISAIACWHLKRGYQADLSARDKRIAYWKSQAKAAQAERDALKATEQRRIDQYKANFAKRKAA